MKTFDILLVIILSCILTNVNTNAKIVYTPINRTLSATLEKPFTEEVHIDMNKDGKEDFGLYHFYPFVTERYGEIFTVGDTLGNEVCCDVNNIPLKFSNGDIISDGLSGWLDTYYKSNLCLRGDWHGINGDFVAVRIIIKGNIYYGWVRLSFPDDVSSMTIIDCAIEDTPGKSITAGDIEITHISDYEKEYFSFISYGKIIKIYINTNNSDFFSGIIYNTNGKVVYGFSSGSQTIALSLDGFEAGLYFICITYSGKKFIKKVILI